MDQALETFLSVALSADGAVDLESTRRGLPRRGPERLNELRGNFRDLIEHRRLSVREWSMINDLDFDDEDALYTYLGAAYEYLFEGAETPPDPPWY